jgi:membrane protein DedA with SNARE-associated domain
MSLQELLQNYGYAVLFVGTFLEGETILVIAGFLAQQGYLKLPLVILVATFGTLVGDQLFFYIGRFKGRRFLEHRPAWEAKSRRARELLRRHQTWTILGFRFVYGIRTVTPFLIGASGIAPLRFLALNASAAIVWAIVIAVLGYTVGNAVQAVLGDVKRYQLWIIAGIAAFGICLWLLRRFAKASGRRG